MREGVARSGPGRWVVGRAGQARGLLSVSEGRWAGSVKELAREGKKGERAAVEVRWAELGLGCFSDSYFYF